MRIHIAFVSPEHCDFATELSAAARLERRLYSRVALTKAVSQLNGNLTVSPLVPALPN